MWSGHFLIGNSDREAAPEDEERQTGCTQLMGLHSAVSQGADPATGEAAWRQLLCLLPPNEV